MRPFTIITPTGDRPEPFKLCLQYVLRQSILPTEWIIVDDGQIPTEVPSLPFIKYIRRERKTTDGKHTLPSQMQEALNHINTEHMIIFEDDDWYCPTYCEKMLSLFDTNSNSILIGQGQSVYYHIPLQKYYDIGNKDRASWCQTGFRLACIPFIQEQCLNKTNPFIDLRVWKNVKSRFLLLNRDPMCVGIKGLPGRTSNATIGHRGTHPHYKPDPSLSRLYSLIGEDVKLYEKFFAVNQTTPNTK